MFLVVIFEIDRIKRGLIMIEHLSGDIMESEAQAFVNSINCVVVIRKRLASPKNPAIPRKLHLLLASTQRGPSATWTHARLRTGACPADKRGWLGITAVIDCRDRELIGLCVSHRGRAQEAEQALEQACLARYGLVYPRGEERAQQRSDNGKVFTSKHFQACCKQYGLSQEFITPYTPQQNGMSERKKRSLMEECIWQHHFKTFEEAKAAIEACVTFYNTKRPHQAFNYRSPAQHRAAHTLLHVA
jgi:putative transposase